MNGDSLVVDTNIVLYLLSGDKTLATLLNNRQIYISFITELELLGYKELSLKDRQKIKNFLSDCRIIDVNARIKESSIDLKQKYNLKLPDCIIAGTAIFLDFPFISADSDFVKIKELNLVLYEK